MGLSVVLVLIYCLMSQLPAQNLRTGFAQVAVGAGVVTSIDLTNKGSATFNGYFAVVDDNGFFLPVRVNGSETSNLYVLSIPAGASRRFEITASGPPEPGFVLIFDDRPIGDIDLSRHISGTAVFQIRDGNRLIDSIGVPESPLLEHFHFVGESTSQTRTGLAIANPGGGRTTITIRAFSSNGGFRDVATLSLDVYDHRSFFIDEILDLPSAYRGTIEVEADGRVLVTALRVDGVQLSTVSVTPFLAEYDVTFLLGDGRRISGTLAFGISNSRVTGLFRTSQLSLESGIAIFTGIGFEGTLLGTIVGSLAGRDLIVTVASETIRTQSRSIAATVIWDDNLEPKTLGSMSGSRRN